MKRKKMNSRKMNGKKMGYRFIAMLMTVLLMSSYSGMALGAVVPPTVSTGSNNDITETSACVYASIDLNGGDLITEYGIKYGISSSSLNQKVPVGYSHTMGSYSAYLNGLQPGTTYYYQAYAWNSAGPSWGGINNFTTEEEEAPEPPPLGPTNIYSPSDGSQLKKQDVTVSWSSVSNAVGYQYSVRDTAASTIISKTSTSGTSFVIPSNLLTEGHEYKVWVGAVDSAGNCGSMSEDIIYFTVTPNTPPPLGPTDIYSPSDGSQINKQNVTVSWGMVSNAMGYQYSVRDMNSTGTGTIISKTSTGSTSFTIPSSSLTEGHQYKVWVGAVDSAGNCGSASEDIVYFTVIPATPKQLGPTNISSPSDGSQINKQNVTVSWSFTTNAVGYQYSVRDMNSTGTGTIVAKTSTSGTSFVIPAGSLTEGHQYKVWVGAVDSAGNCGSASEDIVYFTVIPATPKQLGPTNISSPSDGSQINKQNVTVSWSSTTNAVGYQYSVRDMNSTGTGTIISKTSTGSTSFTIPSSSLTEGHQYKVWVGAVDSAGNCGSASEDIIYFTVAASTPGVVNINSPTEGSTLNKADVQVNWNTVANAHGYKYSVLDVTNNSRIIPNTSTSGTSFIIPASSLVESHQYKIWVEALDSNGAEVYSSQALRYFSVQKTTSSTVQIVPGTISVNPGRGNPGDTFTFSANIKGSPSLVYVYFDLGKGQTGSWLDKTTCKGNFKMLPAASANADGTVTYSVSKPINSAGYVKDDYKRYFRICAVDGSNNEVSSDISFFQVKSSGNPTAALEIVPGTAAANPRSGAPGDTFTFSANVQGAPSSVYVYFDRGAGKDATWSDKKTCANNFLMTGGKPNADGSVTYTFSKAITGPGLATDSYHRYFRICAVGADGKEVMSDIVPFQVKSAAPPAELAVTKITVNDGKDLVKGASPCPVKIYYAYTTSAKLQTAELYIIKDGKSYPKGPVAIPATTGYGVLEWDYSFSSPGKYQVQVVITDVNGKQATEKAEVTVKLPPKPKITEFLINSGQPVTRGITNKVPIYFNGEAEGGVKSILLTIIDPKNKTETYTVNSIADKFADWDLSTKPSGKYTFRLVIEDKNGLKSDTAEVKVNIADPVINQTGASITPLNSRYELGENAVYTGDKVIVTASLEEQYQKVYVQFDYGSGWTSPGIELQRYDWFKNGFWAYYGTTLGMDKTGLASNGYQVKCRIYAVKNDIDKFYIEKDLGGQPLAVAVYPAGYKNSQKYTADDAGKWLEMLCDDGKASVLYQANVDGQNYKVIKVTGHTISLADGKVQLVETTGSDITWAGHGYYFVDNNWKLVTNPEIIKKLEVIQNANFDHFVARQISKNGDSPYESTIEGIDETIKIRTQIDVAKGFLDLTSDLAGKCISAYITAGTSLVKIGADAVKDLALSWATSPQLYVHGYSMGVYGYCRDNANKCQSVENRLGNNYISNYSDATTFIQADTTAKCFVPTMNFDGEFGGYYEDYDFGKWLGNVWNSTTSSLIGSASDLKIADWMKKVAAVEDKLGNSVTQNAIGAFLSPLGDNEEAKEYQKAIEAITHEGNKQLNPDISESDQTKLQAIIK